MAAKAMWEVDPETRSKLLAMQKEAGNGMCCDCGAPSPQWASPKFGIFICLTCAGLHRGLGVHISFVRSISMDAFKPAEMDRMRLGGNDRWRAFALAHTPALAPAPAAAAPAATWDDDRAPVTPDRIAARYAGPVGEEYKDRLTCLVDGRVYQPPRRRPAAAASARVDDAYFARLGSENAARPDRLPPSMGGRYGGFGNAVPAAAAAPDALPGYEDLQRDPVAALAKGFGWFTHTVTKTAKTVNDGYIQPTAAKLAELDLAKQAQQTAAQVARTAQLGARSAHEGLSRFVDGAGTGAGRPSPYGALDPGHKSFWDDFSALADRPAALDAKPPAGALGTSAMAGLSGLSGSRSRSPKEGEEWDDW